MIAITPAPWETEFHRRAPIIYPFSSLMGFGFLSAGAARSVSVPRLLLNTNVGANRLCETAEDLGLLLDDNGKSQWQYPTIASVVMAPGIPGNPVDSLCQAGFSIGSSNALTDPANPGFGLAKLFYDCFNLRWMLRTAKGDGTAYVDTALAGVTLAPLDGTPLRVMLVYNPGVSVQAYVNGVLGATAATSIPIATSASNQRGLTCFVHSSNNALDGMNCDYFTGTIERVGRP